MATAVILLSPTSASAQDAPAPTLAAPQAAQVTTASNPSLGNTASAAPTEPEPRTSEPDRNDAKNWLASYPLPILLSLIIGTSTLIAAAGGVLIGFLVTPKVMRDIASEQSLIANKAAGAAEKNAAAAADSAKAAARNAEAAVKNSDNLGLHEVARRRQQWIDTVRDELAQLHSLLMNWAPLAAGANLDEVVAHGQRTRDANARLAKIELLLNPRETASRGLVKVLHRLNDADLTANQRRRGSRWIVRWGQIVLKAEWDRVRAELQGQPVDKPFRRGRRR